MKKQVILISIILSVFLLKTSRTSSQELVATFGKSIHMKDVLSGKLKNAKPVKWYQVNTEADSWRVSGETLKCTGLPIGVIRSEKEYENFIMHIEWSHRAPGGNSGTFVWSKAQPGENRLPDGVEYKYWTWNGSDSIPAMSRAAYAYVHGELSALEESNHPENPRGKRSKSIENRVKGTKEWIFTR